MAAIQSTYLKQLKFNQKLVDTFVGKYLSNPRFFILIILAIVIVGITSFNSIPRVLNPEVKLPMVIVSAVLPGANPKDIESLVTEPVENAVSGLPKVKSVNSTSSDSVSVTTLEFESGVDPEKARADVQSAVDGITTFPKDVKAPKVQKIDFENQPVWVFSVTTTKDLGSLMKFSKNLSDKLKDLPSIDRSVTSGLEDQEVQILIKPEAISTYKINPLLLAQGITASLGSYPAGIVKTQDSSFSLSIDASSTSVDDLRKIIVSVDGNSVPLSDIAFVSERSKPEQIESFYASSKTSPTRSVTFYLYKTNTATVKGSIDEAKETIDESLKTYNNSFTVSSIVNISDMIDKQFDELFRDFALTVILVFIVLLLFLGLRQAIVASLAIPLTFLLSFTVMNLFGITINFLSLFSLLLALGLLVDDAIVVASAMTAYHRTGKFTPIQTGLLVWRDFIVAIFTTTITTVWAFLPLLLSSGIIGEYIKPIPIVTSSTLLASFVVAMLITLPFIIVLLEGKIPHRVRILLRVVLYIILAVIVFSVLPKNNVFILELLASLALLFVVFINRTYFVERIVNGVRRLFGVSKRKETNKKNVLDDANKGFVSFEPISRKYHEIIERILHSRGARVKVIIMVILFSIFSYLLFPLGFVKNEFFPKGDADYIYVSLELPSGTNYSAAKDEAIVILEKLRMYEGTSFVIADLGSSMSSSGSQNSGSNSVLFSMELLPKEERKITSVEIGDKIRDEFKSYPKGKISITEETGGPPAGEDLQIKLYGDDLAVLDTYADSIQDYLKKQPGIANINKSIKPGTSKLVFNPDRNKLAENSVTQDSVGLWLRMFASGFTVGNVKFENNGGDTKDIVIRTSSYTQNPEMIYAISIPTPNGTVPLSSLGGLKLETNPTLITREDGKRTISVAASVLRGYSVSTSNKQLEQYADTLNLPPGYSWKTGGINEENQKSVNSILLAMILSFLLIITTLVIQFGSYRKTLIVMLVIPLSISGVFIIFSLTNTPLSFPALIGVLALFGIVVKNSILVVDKISQNLHAGIPFVTSIADGAASRLEAIALTSFTAILGLVPVTLSDPIWRGLGGAIISGLAFSGTIMLFFIPVVYYYWFRSSNEAKK